MGTNLTKSPEDLVMQVISQPEEGPACARTGTAPWPWDELGWVTASGEPARYCTARGGHISGDARLSARSSLPVALLLISSISNAALQDHKWLLFFTGIIVNQHLVVHNTHALEFWLCFCQ